MLLIGRTARAGFLALVGLACVGPVLWVVLSSFKTQAQIFGAGDLLPSPVSFDGYRALFTQIDVTSYLLNTLLYAGGGTFGALAVAFLAAYPAARLQFPFRRALTLLFSAGLAIPIAGLIVPEFVIMRELGLFDSRAGMIVFYSAMWFPLAISRDITLRAMSLAYSQVDSSFHPIWLWADMSRMSVISAFTLFSNSFTRSLRDLSESFQEMCLSESPRS